MMDDETATRTVNYTRAKLSFDRREGWYSATVLTVFLVTGLLPSLFVLFSSTLGGGVWAQAAALYLIGIALQLPGLPFDYARQFKLEERFGFNRSTLRLWVADQVKGMLVGALLLIPLAALLLAIVGWFPRWWWLIGYAVYFGFMLTLMVLYPRWILPLFNKLEPLPPGELRERLLKLAEKARFTAQNILVIDGSKRSSHANAYFSGFGKFRQIVLFDTLIDQLEHPELEAVLAHEIGHYRKGHIPKMLIISAATGLLGFAAIAWLAQQPWFLTGFGFPADSGVAAVFLLFGIVSGVVTFWFSPILSRLSRHHEYEADQFAREMVGGPDSLVAALRKLSQKNLSNLLPHPLYSGWYYSHPTVIERESALAESGN